jgi:hypothetical protein
MFGVKILAALVLAGSLITGGSSSCRSSKAKSQSNSMNQTDNGPAADLQVIAEGSVSPVKSPFVGVIRDAETYATLRGISPNLPELNQQYFQSNLVIAAFLGERNTGGYSVAISRESSGQIRINEKAPRKDAIVTQMITSPFKVVSLALNGTAAVQLSLDERFKQNAQLYRISEGTFTTSGGFAGRSDSYQLNGKLQVTRLYPLMTIGFAIVSSGVTRERTLRDVATGLVKDGELVIGRMNHGSLIDTPSGDLQVRGRFAEGNKLLLELNTGPVTVPDGYAGKGTIQAQLVAASAN